MSNIYIAVEDDLKSRGKRDIFMKSWQTFEGSVT